MVKAIVNGEEENQGSRTKNNNPPGGLEQHLGAGGDKGYYCNPLNLLGWEAWSGQTNQNQLSWEASLSWVENLNKRNDFSKFVSDPPTKFVQIKH